MFCINKFFVSYVQAICPLIIQDLYGLCSWLKTTCLLFNFNKCIVLHYGNNNSPNFEYTLFDHLLQAADSTNDLGIVIELLNCHTISPVIKLAMLILDVF